MPSGMVESGHRGKHSPVSGTGVANPRAIESNLEVKKRLSHASANSHVVSAAPGKLGHLSPGVALRKREVAKSKK